MRLSILAGLALLPAFAFAQRDAANLPLVALPPLPKDANLVLQPANPGDTVKVFVDRTSVQVEDGEARLVYVIEAPSGVRSVFLDGFRCTGRQYSTYATGGGDGKWTRIETPSWQTAARVRTNNPRAVLLDDGYLCGRFWEQLPAAEVLRRLGRIIDTAPP